MELITKYFPNLTDEQKTQFEALYDLYLDWNSKINVISRKDINNLYTHHVLHSLGIAKAVTFRPGTKIMDIGTGGGFPGIPLAVMFPHAEFTLCDSIGKKITVATIFGKMRYDAEFTPISSRASICSVIRIVPISEAILEPTLPARISATTVDENSSTITSRVEYPIIN